MVLDYAIVYAITFAQTIKYTQKQPFKRRVHLHPPYPPWICHCEFMSLQSSLVYKWTDPKNITAA